MINDAGKQAVKETKIWLPAKPDFSFPAATARSGGA
jgi:hypothetical protein